MEGPSKFGTKFSVDEQFTSNLGGTVPNPKSGRRKRVLLEDKWRKNNTKFRNPSSL